MTQVGSNTLLGGGYLEGWETVKYTQPWEGEAQGGGNFLEREGSYYIMIMMNIFFVSFIYYIFSDGIGCMLRGVGMTLDDFHTVFFYINYAGIFYQARVKWFFSVGLFFHVF